MAVPDIVDGDLLSQPVDVIVNAWNRNIIPWWLLVPQGVSGAIKRKAGLPAHGWDPLYQLLGYTVQKWKHPGRGSVG